MTSCIKFPDDRHFRSEGPPAHAPASFEIVSDNGLKHAGTWAVNRPAAERPSDACDNCLRSLVPLRRQLTSSSTTRRSTFRKVSNSAATHPSIYSEGDPISIRPWVSQPGRLVEGVVVIVEGEDEKLVSAECWPQEVAGTKLQSLLCQGGFCPTPEVFRMPHPNGFNERPSVLALLETALNGDADPSSEMYVCLDSGCCSGSLTCLVSRVPLFAFHFEILRLLRNEDCNRAALIEQLVAHRMDAQLFTDGIRIQQGGVETLTMLAPLSPALPVPFPLVRQEEQVHSFASWQAGWGLECLLDLCPSFVGEPLLQLLTHALMEERILLLGEPQRIAAVAFALRGLLWPFKWLHLFLSAPLQGAAAVSLPIEDAPFPMIAALPCLPARFPTVRRLPRGVVAVELGALTQEMQRPTDTNVAPWKAGRLPDNGHVGCLQEIASVKNRHQRGELRLPEVVQQIQESIRARIAPLADSVSRYVRGHLDQERDSSPDAVYRNLSNVNVFLKWSFVSRKDRAFYEAFFTSQMCLEILYQEIEDQLAGRGRPDITDNMSGAARREACWPRWSKCMGS